MDNVTTHSHKTVTKEKAPYLTAVGASHSVTNEITGLARLDQSQCRKWSCFCWLPYTDCPLSPVCCCFPSSKYLTLQSHIIIQLFVKNKSKNGENSQGKNYSQSHAVSWQVLQWDSRLMLLKNIFHFCVIDKQKDKYKLHFSICGCFWWRDLVSVLLCFCGLHHSLCISIIKVINILLTLFIGFVIFIK